MHKYLTIALLSVSILSCEGPDPESAELTPLTVVDGKMDIKFKDSKLETSKSISLINGEVFALSLSIKKGTDGNKPVKMGAYISSSAELRGTFLCNFKLKEIDEQTQSMEVILPEAGLTISRVFYVEITDNKGKFTRKFLNVLPSSTKQISTWSNIILGVQNSSFPARFSSATGDAYIACDLDSNINFVDITYATIASPSLKPTILSNTRRAALGLGNTATDKNCSNVVASGGTTTFFVALPTLPTEFVNLNDFNMKLIEVPTTAQEVVIEAGKFYGFLHSRITKDGKMVSRRGVLRVNSISNAVSTTGATLPFGAINIDVKIQR